MLKNYIYSSLNKTNKKLVTQLAINCLIVSIEQTVFLYAQGYFEFEQDITTGRSKMEQALQVFKILGENDIYSQYADHYTETIGSKKHSDI